MVKNNVVLMAERDYKCKKYLVLLNYFHRGCRSEWWWHRFWNHLEWYLPPLAAIYLDQIIPPPRISSPQVQKREHRTEAIFWNDLFPLGSFDLCHELFHSVRWGWSWLFWTVGWCGESVFKQYWTKKNGHGVGGDMNFPDVLELNVAV